MNYYNTRPNEDNRNLYTFTEKAIEILVSYKLFEMQKLKRLGIETCQGFSLTYNNSFEEEKEWERRQEINKEAFETARHDFIIDLDGIRHEDEF